MEYNGLSEPQTVTPSPSNSNQGSSSPIEDYRPQPAVTHRPAGGVTLCYLNQVAERPQQWLDSQEADRSDEETDCDYDSSFCLHDMEMDGDETFSNFDTDIDQEDASTNDSVMDQEVFVEMTNVLAEMRRSRDGASQAATTDAAHTVNSRGQEEGAEASPAQNEVEENLSPLDLLAFVAVNIAKKI